ncbi:MAG: hypothetical protein AVDCRST_MAG85-1981, partial [uncultured Solirubrobacteraceae bacterium]
GSPPWRSIAESCRDSRGARGPARSGGASWGHAQREWPARPACGPGGCGRTARPCSRAMETYASSRPRSRRV